MRTSSQPALIVGTLAVVASFMTQGAASQAPPGGQAPSSAAPAAPNPAAPGQGRGGPQTPQVVSPEVSAERRVTFRIYAPQADAVRVSAGDIPNLGQTGVMTKAETSCSG